MFFLIKKRVINECKTIWICSRAYNGKTAEIFRDIQADYIFFGHNHNPSKFSINKQKFYCVGSLGIGFPGNYILIETKRNYIRVFRKHIFFDRKQLKKDMQKENYPRAKIYAKWFR